jgi:hypothetical protein
MSWMLEKETERKRNTLCVGCWRRKTTGRNNICSIYITQEEEEEEEEVFLIRNIMCWMLGKEETQICLGCPRRRKTMQGTRKVLDAQEGTQENVWEQMYACVRARSRTLLSLGLAVQSEG